MWFLVHVPNTSTVHRLAKCLYVGNVGLDNLLRQWTIAVQSRSQDGIAFLEGLGVNLSTIVRLGGHSIPRTRSNPTGPNVGFYLVKAVAARVQEAPNVEVKTNTKVGRHRDAQGLWVSRWCLTNRQSVQAGQEQVLPAAERLTETCKEG